VRVFWASAEDSAARVIKPRLVAAGADLSLVSVIGVEEIGAHDDEDGEPMLTLPRDVSMLREAVGEHEARVLFLDPLGSFLSSKTDAHKDASVRRALGPLARLSDELDLATLANMHLNKDGGHEVLYRLIGSVAFGGAARSVLFMARDPEDPDAERGLRRVIAHAKNNLGPCTPSAACHVEGVALEPELLDLQAGEKLATSRVAFDGAHAATARELLAAAARSEDDGPAVADAKEWLVEVLAHGPVLAGELKARAKDEGHAPDAPARPAGARHQPHKPDPEGLRPARRAERPLRPPA
jgi:hypothetical protein